MGASAGLMMAGSSMVGAYSQSQGARAQGDYQRGQSYLNASLAERQADEAIVRGRGDANTAKRKGDALVGSQKAAMAAQGVNIADGSAVETITSTQNLSEVEQMNIKTNAWREAWGYRVSAINERTQGEMAQLAGDTAAKQTLIAGGMQAVGYGASGYRAMGRNSTPTGSSSVRGYAGSRQYTSNEGY